MPPKRRKLKKTTQEEVATFSPQMVPLTLQAPYTGPDRLTVLPDELIKKICEYLHAPDEARWSDKADLKAMHLTHSRLREIAKAELFRYMKLHFTYSPVRWFIPDSWKWEDHLLPTGIWKVPKLIHMIEDEEALAEYVQAVQVTIVPVPVPIPRYHMGTREGLLQYLPKCSVQGSLMLVDMEKDRTQATQFSTDDPTLLDTYGYVDDVNTSSARIRTAKEALSQLGRTGKHPDDIYYHLFCREPHHYKEPIGTPFAEFVLDCMRRRILPHLKNLTHLEPGVWQGPKPDGWKPTDFEFVRRWGIIFANALILKTTAYRCISSLGIRSVTPEYHQMEWAVFGVRQVLTRFRDFGHFLTNLDLNVELLREPLTGDRPFARLTSGERRRWPNGVKFWAEMLQRLHNLKSLKLVDGGYRFERRNEETLSLDQLLPLIKLPKVRVLHLSGWSITAATLAEKLPAACSNLIVLDLEMLDLHSDDEQAWQMVFGFLKKKYSAIEISPQNLRRRPLHGSDRGYVKALVKKQGEVQRQVDDVWRKIAEQEDDDAEMVE